MTDEAHGRAVLEALTARCAALFGAGLTGVYAHGSLALGCFRWARSDLDFLLVTDREPTGGEKEALARLLLAACADAPPKGLEMSSVRRESCTQSPYPAPFDFHFSPMHMRRCAADPAGYSRAMHGRDPDLTAHFAMTRARGLRLYGPEPEAVFGPVPRDALLRSFRNDLADGPGNDAGYFVLNLCRALAYARDGLLLSKAEGAKWAAPRYPMHRAVIEAAAAQYAGGADVVCPAAARRFGAEARALR